MKKVVMLALLVLGTTAFANGTQTPTSAAPAKEAPAKKHHKKHHHKAKKVEATPAAAPAKK